MKIAFFDTKDYDIELFEKYNKTYNYEFTFFKTKLNEETARLAEGADVVSIFANDNANKEVLEKLKEYNINLIAVRGAGYNQIDMKNLPKEITVVRVPEYSPYAIAEHTCGLLLTLDRKIYKAYQRTKKYNFTLDGLLGFDIHNKTIGIIGAGKIGKAFIKIMNGFGAHILVYDVYQNKEMEKELNFKYVTLEELYKNSDIISLHCPLTEDNVHLINKESISKMKNGVYILNTGRGKLINTQDLIEMLEKGKIGGVGLDVYEEEEEYFLNDMSNSYIRDAKLSTLLSMPNVIITSHQAFFTREEIEEIAKTTIENIHEFESTGKCANSV